MIFKVKQADTGKWFYYDNVFLFKVKYDIRQIDQPTTGNEIILLPQERDPEKNVTHCDLNFINNEKEYLTVIFDTEAYLLNNEGKTIERIS